MIYTDEKFLTFRNQMIEHFNTNMAGKKLYHVNISNNKLFNKYLEVFPKEAQVIYRTKRFHDCSACQKFFRKMANVVAMDENCQIISLFDFETIPEYQDVINILSNLVHNVPIRDVFTINKNRVGISENYEQLDDGDVYQHNHFYLDIPEEYINLYTESDVVKFRSDYEVLHNGITEISVNAVKQVLEMIEQGILYRGDEWKHLLVMFKKLQRDYFNLGDDDLSKNYLIWSYVTSALGRPFSHIKNHSIGVLLKDLTDGIDCETAIRRYEHIMAPQNYQRPKPIFTEKMLEDAKVKIEELGYLDSLQRRYATIDDIDVNNVLFVNRNIKQLNTTDSDDLFASLEKEAIVKPKAFNNAESMTMEDFINNILPTAETVEMYFDARLRNNLASLIAPINKDSETMFKWGNNFSWAYRNNVADSLKERVRKAGGAIDGDLRFSIQWNHDTISWNKCDYDAHCNEPNGNVIYYSNMYSSNNKGELDVDVINPTRGVPAVENITYPHRKYMDDGKYLFRVHCFSARSGNDGFEAEIEFDGNIYSFDYPYHIDHGKFVDVATVTLDNGVFSIDSHLSNNVQSKTIWNINTNKFVPVNLICYSPNYWNEDDGYGNKHVFFMIDDCVSDVEARPWFNEFLNNELTENRKVMEALAHKAEVEVCDNQLSGFGFSSTLKNVEFVVKVNGSQIIRVIN